MLYALPENFVLPVPHDEVVHLKKAWSRDARDEWPALRQHAARSRVHVYASRKELLFMGCEFGQTEEWTHTTGLPWHLLAFDFHSIASDHGEGAERLYRREPSLYEVDDDYSGFEWIDFRDAEASIISFLRFAKNREISS